ncbi:hypothetical protein N7512_001581 [Penicillium capsulatum]|nr:hypothetical protein N7512_001581 [Penicillium capsulatum]
MSESLLSVLTAEPWGFDPNAAQPVQIRFQENGTGEGTVTDLIKLLCVIELSVFIAVEFDWKISDSPTESKRNIGTGSPTTPTQLAQMEIKMTLTKRLPPRLQQSDIPNLPTAEHWFTNEAFQPKRLTVHLQQGKFPAQTQSDVTNPSSDRQRFSLRLAFTPSVFPPVSEWKAPDGAPAAYQFWQWKEFCSRKLPEMALGRIQDTCSIMKLVLHCVLEVNHPGTFNPPNTIDTYAFFDSRSDRQSDLHTLGLVA